MRRLLGFGLRLAALAAVLFVAAQWAAGMTGGGAVGTAVQRLEAADVGVGAPAVAALAGGARVTIACESGPAPRALLLRNGRPVADFRRRTVTVDVEPGDLLAIDGRAYPRRLEFLITFAGPELARPRPGERVETVGDVAFVARVGAR